MNINSFFQNPNWYPTHIDTSNGTITLVQMSRESYWQSVFLDDRIVTGSTVKQEAALSSFPVLPLSRCCHFIFHHAFCGSTLLTRLLDIPGIYLAYREPHLLHQFSWNDRFPATLAAANPPLDLIYTILSRTYEAEEIALIKPSDCCNNLISALIDQHPDNKGILLYSTLPEFLLSTLKHPARRKFLRSLACRSELDAQSLNSELPHQAPIDNDAQLASYVWFVQMQMFARKLAEYPDQLRSLYSGDLFQRPGQVLSAAANFLAFSLAETEIAERLDSDLLNKNAKILSQQFDPIQYQEKNQQLLAGLGNEISSGINWAEHILGTETGFEHLQQNLLNSR